jgi:hypothetical protein
MYHGEAADIAALLLPLIDGAHVTQRLRTGGGQGHARGGVLVDRPLEVVLEFLGELLLDATAAKQRAETQAKASSKAHRGSFVLRSA